MYLQEEEADETRPLLAAGIDNWQWQEDQGDLDMRMMVKAFPGKIATTTKQVIFKNFLGELKLSFEVFFAQSVYFERTKNPGLLPDFFSKKSLQDKHVLVRL